MEETSSNTSKDGNQLTTFSTDELVEVDSRKLFKRPTKLSVFFAILAILFFIIMVVFIILYFNKQPKICTSQECLRTASNYRSSMNDSVDPCDNFYEFVCGRWSEEHPNHFWESSFYSASIIREKIVIDSVNILSEEMDIDNEPEAVKKSKHFYKSCLDIETRDKMGIAVIYPYLEKMNLPIVPSFMTTGNKSDVKFNWMLTDTLAKQILQMDIFIGYVIGPNMFNSSQNVLSVGNTLRKSPLPRHKITWENVKEFGNKDNDTAKELARNLNINLITYVMNELILNKTGQKAVGDLLKEAADVIIEMSDLIDEIITNTTNSNQQEEQEEDKFSITVENLQNEIIDYLKKPNHNFFTTYFSYLFNNTNVTINNASDLIYVTKGDVNYLKRIMDYLAELPDINIELYMWWSTVSAMMFNTSSDIASYILKQVSAFSGNHTSIVSQPRSVSCTLLLVERGFLQYAISYALADRSFQKETISKVENMMLEIKQEFSNSVKSLTWTDSKTNEAIFEKIKEMLTFIGYPNWLLKKGELDKYYKSIIIKPDTFLENMLNIITSDAKQNMNSLREIPKRDEWDMSPAVVNAYYAANKNSLYILMGILHFPFYNLGLEALNYGAIGTLLGHEMIHGFDNIGRKYDKNGNKKQWWTNQTIKNFENLTECFVKQYEHFIIPGVKEHVNGKLSLGENLADNGGLNQAFKAYTNFIRKYGKEPKLPGFENYNNYQLFFIAYANHWCTTTNAQDLKERIHLDVHSPEFIRVLGVLQNSESFANTFECPEDSPMNPKKKCKIW